MESDVTTTLSELERKLKELERELESVGRTGETDVDPAQGGWTPAPEPDDAPGPPPAGATPFTAVWHGTAGAAAPPPPASAFNGTEPVPVTPPAAPWPPAPAAAAPPAYASPPPPAAAAPPAYAPPPSAPAAPAPPAYAPPPLPPTPDLGLHRQLDELLAFRDRLVATTDDLVSELSRVLTELGVGAAPAPDPADTLLHGDVVVDAAPFGDLATLSAFEQALARVPGVTDVHVRTLDAGRATIDVRLAGPVALAAALRATAPLPFAVTDVRDGRLTLAVASSVG